MKVPDMIADHMHAAASEPMALLHSYIGYIYCEMTQVAGKLLLELSRNGHNLVLYVDILDTNSVCGPRGTFHTLVCSNMTRPRGNVRSIVSMCFVRARYYIRKPLKNRTACMRSCRCCSCTRASKDVIDTSLSTYVCIRSAHDPQMAGQKHFTQDAVLKLLHLFCAVSSGSGARTALHGRRPF